MVVLMVRKQQLWKPPSGKNRQLWIWKKTILLPTDITNINEFARLIQMNFGEGYFSILGNAKRHKGFYRIFLGEIKNNRATGSGKIHYYLAKNKQKLANRD